MKTKSIEWSYPSSTNAVRFGHRKTGCWTVQTRSGDDAPVSLFGHPDPAVAFRNALPLPYPWWETWMRYMDSVFHEHFFPCAMVESQSSIRRFPQPVWMPVSHGRTELGSVLANGYFDEGTSYDGHKNWLIVRPAVTIFPGLRHFAAGDAYHVSIAWLNQLADLGHQAA